MTARRSGGRIVPLALQLGVALLALIVQAHGALAGSPPGSDAEPGSDASRAAAPPAEESRRFTLVEVSPSVVMARHAYGANITCIALEDGLVFVESGMSTEIAAEFRSAMEAKFEKKTKALLLTHGHIDHFLGMGAFSDVDVVAAAAGKELFEKQLAIEFDEEKIEAYTQIFPKFKESIGTAKPFLPTVWFDEEISFSEGSRRLVFRNSGGHSSCSSYVFFEPEGLVVAGDLVQVDQYPYFGDPTTDLEAWIGTLKLWAGMEVRKIAPGHGRVVDRAYLPQVWGFFESLIATLKELKAEGVAVEEAVRHPRLPKGYWDEGLPEPRWWTYCIASLYRSL